MLHDRYWQLNVKSKKWHILTCHGLWYTPTVNYFVHNHDVCGLRSPSFDFVVWNILHLVIPLPCKTWYYKECNKNYKKTCNRCNKDTWHVESNYVLQPSKYLLLLVNRFRYTNNNVTKDRCSTHMDATVILGPHKFSLRDTKDHHGPSIHSGHYAASINCCKKQSIATTTKLRSLKLLIAKAPLLHMFYFMN